MWGRNNRKDKDPLRHETTAGSDTKSMLSSLKLNSHHKEDITVQNGTGSIRLSMQSSRVGQEMLPPIGTALVAIVVCWFLWKKPGTAKSCQDPTKEALKTLHDEQEQSLREARNEIERLKVVLQRRKESATIMTARSIPLSDIPETEIPDDDRQELLDQLKAAEKAKNDLQEKYNQLVQDQELTLKAASKDVESRFATLKREHAALLDKVQAEKETVVASLKREMENTIKAATGSKSAIDELKSENENSKNDLQAKIDALQAENDKLTKQLEAKETTTVERVATVMAEKNAPQSLLEEATEEAKDVQAQLDEAEKSVLNLQASLEERATQDEKAQLELLIATKLELETSLKNQSDQLELQLAEKEELQTKINNLEAAQAQASEVQRELDAAIFAKLEFQAKVEAAAKGKDVLQEKLGQAEEKIDQLEFKLRETLLKQSTLATELEGTKIQAQSAAEAFEMEKQEVLKAVELLKQENTSLGEAQQQLKKDIDEVEDLKAKVVLLVDIRNKMEAEIQSLKGNDNEKKELQEKQDLIAEVAMLKEQIERMTNTREHGDRLQAFHAKVVAEDYGSNEFEILRTATTDSRDQSELPKGVSLRTSNSTSDDDIQRLKDENAKLAVALRAAEDKEDELVKEKERLVSNATNMSMLLAENRASVESLQKQLDEQSKQSALPKRLSDLATADGTDRNNTRFGRLMTRASSVRNLGRSKSFDLNVLKGGSDLESDFVRGAKELTAQQPAPKFKPLSPQKSPRNFRGLMQRNRQQQSDSVPELKGQSAAPVSIKGESFEELNKFQVKQHEENDVAITSLMQEAESKVQTATQTLHKDEDSQDVTDSDAAVEACPSVATANPSNTTITTSS